MELYQLECFLTVAHTQHMTQAAEQLHMTQPSLSKVISRLEEDLGTQLFYREGRRIRLNEQGELAAKYARSLLHMVDDMRSELTELSQGSSGMIRVGSSYSTQDTGWLLECVRDFLLDRPHIHFSLQSYEPNRLAKALENREIDLAISMWPLQAQIRSESIFWKELFYEPMGVILSADHPLAVQDTISLSDLEHEHFLCNDANSDTREMTIRFCERAGFQPDICFECFFPSYIGEAVSRGAGISLISESGNARSHNHEHPMDWEKNIVFRPIKETYCRRVYGIAYLKYRHPQKSVLDFQAFLRDYVAQLPDTAASPIVLPDLPDDVQDDLIDETGDTPWNSIS